MAYFAKDIFALLRRSTYAGLMLAHRLRRLANIEQTLVQHLVFVDHIFGGGGEIRDPEGKGSDPEPVLIHGALI